MHDNKLQRYEKVWRVECEVRSFFVAIHKKADEFPHRLFSTRFPIRLFCHFGFYRDDIHV